MFLGSTEIELEDGFLRSGRRFRSGKRIKKEEGQRAPSLFESENSSRSWTKVLVMKRRTIA